MNPNEPQASRRWYDAEPNTAQAFSIIPQLRSEYRQAFGHVITVVTTKLREVNKFKQPYISLGTERAIGLIKTQERRRATDQDRVLHKAFTNLYILPDQQRTALTQRISVSVSCVELYRQVCARVAREENFKEVLHLINQTIEKGLGGGHRVMMSLGLCDAQVQEGFNHLAQVFNESLIFPLAETTPVAAIVKPERSHVVESATTKSSVSGKRHRARLIEDASGMKIHRQEPLV